MTKNVPEGWPRCHGQPMTRLGRTAATTDEGMRIESGLYECALCWRRLAQPERWVASRRRQVAAGKNGRGEEVSNGPA